MTAMKSAKNKPSDYWLYSVTLLSTLLLKL